MISITGHFERPKVKRLAAEAKIILQSLGSECTAADIKKKKFNAKNVSLVIAVGGDGTLLRTVRELGEQKPILGIAAGEQCALMQIKPAQLRKALRKIVEGKYKVQGRMRLQAIADGKKLPLALNEAMLLNKKSGAIINYRLVVNGKRIYCARADGCIVATPTGSSGHAFSAGGKRLSAGSSKIAIVPSNPLNRAVKAVYAKGNSRIALSGLNSKQGCEVVLDGQPRFAVKKKLLVERGKDALFVRI
ncbi:MAG: NAD(+)/NADH kinase [Candidatus Diapherotrites archaeon]|nr:NAD(+)/NADH kinase [Candidatus Diapherotrites archaeon]